MRPTLLLLALLACRGEAELLTSDCAGAECPVCEADADCIVVHNPCHETALCGHSAEALGVNLIGCSAALEYDTPPASDCTCEAERCTAAP